MTDDSDDQEVCDQKEDSKAIARVPGVSGTRAGLLQDSYEFLAERMALHHDGIGCGIPFRHSCFIYAAPALIHNDS